MPLQGHRLSGDSYVRIEPDSAGGLESQELGQRLVMVEQRLRFYRLDTGERLLTRTERAEREAERAEREAESRHAAEVARLRAELARRASPEAPS